MIFFDPHVHWSEPYGAGGPTWDVVENAENAEISSHLKTFSTFRLDHRQELDQTVVRIPLRTKSQALTSEIILNKEEVTVSHVEQALRAFSQNIQAGDLLFLKHVRKITIRIDSEIILIAEILLPKEGQANVRDKLSADFLQLYGSSSTINPTKAFRTFETRISFTDESRTWVDRYLISHLMAPSSNSSQLHKWARTYKLFPWVAVAAPLDGTVSLAGTLFATH